MKRFKTIPKSYKSRLLLLGGVLLSVYFTYHAVYGDRSFEKLASLEAQLRDRQVVLAEVKAKRESLERDVKMLRPDTLSLDLLEERARYVLGYKNSDEYVVLRN